MHSRNETVLITGGSGLIGKHLTRKLMDRGYDVYHLTRSFGKEKSFYWNPKSGFISEDALINTNHIIHLAGVGIADKRWNFKRKQEILDSRVHTARLLLDAILKSQAPVKTFVTASAIGFYGDNTGINTETTLPGNGFLATVCKHWESMADAFSQSGIRTLKIRTGMVITKEGGFLSLMSLMVKLGLAAPLGSGNQSMPWIHIDDLCEIYCQCIENEEWTGVINAVAPEDITNKTFTRILAREMKRPFWPFNIPAFLIRWVLGERSVLVLQGSPVQPKRLLDMDFPFKYSEIGAALESVTELQ